MKHSYLPLLALWLLPMIGRTASPPPPWAASAQAPTAFAVPEGQDAAIMAQAVSLLNGWKSRDSQMYPMPILTSTVSLIQTEDPTALGLFGVKITDTHTSGVALIAIETSAYEGRIFEVSQQRHDANKRAHLLAYLLEQSAGVTLSPVPATAPPAVSQSGDTFGPAMQRLQSQIDTGQYDGALATLEALRAEIITRRSQVTPASK